MWNKISSIVKSGPSGKTADEEYPQAGPSSSPSKRKSGFGSLKLVTSPLKIPHKVKSSFNLHGNSSQLTVASQADGPNRSQELLANTNTAPRQKAARRSSFNLLTRRPSLDALSRPAPRRQSIDMLRIPPRLPPDPESRSRSPSPDYTRERAATVSGSASGSMRSILREPNTPGAGKNVRFFGGTFDLDNRMNHISRSTPPEEVVFQSSPSKTASPKTSYRRVSPKSKNRPSVVDIFAPSAVTASFFKQLDGPPIPSSPTASVHALGSALDLAEQRKDNNKTPTTSHSRNASLSDTSVVSKRSSSSKSESSDAETSFTTSSASSHSSHIDCLPNPEAPPVGDRDPFAMNAKTFYAPQSMIPTTPPNGSRHVRRASKEESIIFSLQAQLAMQSELCGQYETDLRARDELVGVLRKKLEEAEEEDAKKKKFLKAWKKKVLELEKTCRYLEDEVETSRQESMERSVMDEASGEALRMLHRQIAALERERDVWKKTEAVLRDELRRLETLIGERRNETAMLRASLGSLSEKEAKQKEEQAALEELKSLVASLEEQLRFEKDKQEAAEKDLEQRAAQLERRNAELLVELELNAKSVQSRDDEVALLKLKLEDALDSAEKAARSLKVSEAGTCSLAMERDAMKLQLSKLQQRQTRGEEADRKVAELRDDLLELREVNQSLQRERDQLNSRLDSADADKRKLDRYEEQTQQQSAALDALRAQMEKMQQEHATALADAQRARAQLESDTTADMLRLKEQVLDLQQENASQEVRMLQITKERAQDKQDLEGLNIALDAKQQELELLKRRLGVRGTAGGASTTATKPPPVSRRESVTPRIPRPSSIASESGAESGRERKASTESHANTPPKMTLTSKNRRMSSSSISPPKSAGTVGSMGPPPLRSRPSIVSANAPRTLTRTTSSITSSATKVATKPAVAKPTAAASAHATATANAASERNEKENSDASLNRSVRATS
uniref:Uncharacterized protein n=1 Tax=Mycena chlorophos TaxID=658473 RepID=A0ABQ0LXN8_MYCCL|nr:predicted protein [Mycena chlorophos]